MNSITSKFPSGYVGKMGEKPLLKLFDSNFFSDSQNSEFEIKVNVGLNGAMQKYQISFAQLDDNEAVVNERVRNLVSGEMITLSKFLQHHGASEGDVIIVVHDFGDFFRLFVHKCETNTTDAASPLPPSSNPCVHAATE